MTQLTPWASRNAQFEITFDENPYTAIALAAGDLAFAQWVANDGMAANWNPAWEQLLTKYAVGDPVTMPFGFWTGYANYSGYVNAPVSALASAVNVAAGDAIVNNAAIVAGGKTMVNPGSGAIFTGATATGTIAYPLAAINQGQDNIADNIVYHPLQFSAAFDGTNVTGAPGDPAGDTLGRFQVGFQKWWP